MLDPPRLGDDVLRQALQRDYDLPVTALTFLPLGNDAASFVYRVEVADGTRRLLKLRSGSGFRVPSLAVPHALQAQGIPHLLAPLPTTTGRLWLRLDDVALGLYPFIDGPTAADAGLPEGHWRALGATLRQIHGSSLPADVRRLTPRDAFVPSRRRRLAELETRLLRHHGDDPAEREFVRFWHAHAERIAAFVERADALGDALRRAPPPSVPCHADLHLWNVLLDGAHEMRIVDWDDTVLAPKERDLMFFIGGIGHGLIAAPQTGWFLEGYGKAVVDPRALRYYRYAWALQDIAAYGETVFFAPRASEAARRAAVDGFIDLFAAGNIVDIACTADLGAG